MWLCSVVFLIWMRGMWRFREALVRADAIDALFVRFDAHLKSLG